MGHILKAQGDEERAKRHYERALRLNPKCHDAERELRLAKMRTTRKPSDTGLFKNLFKKS